MNRRRIHPHAGQRMCRFARGLAWGPSLALILVGTGAHAQGAPSADTAQQPANAASSDASGAILVTAQKRNEDIKDVPISVSVISGAELEKRRIQTFDELAKMTPGVAIYNTGGDNLARIVIRGISSTQGTATVGVYLDDVSLTVPNLFFTGATLPRLFDINHVEALRGPQGTLFGASALGGALRFITNKPQLDTMSGAANADISNTRYAGGLNYQIGGMLNVPVVDDKVAVRVAFQNGKNAGYIDRVDTSGVVHRGINEERYTAVRATMLAKPTEGLTIEPALLWQKTSADGTDLSDLTTKFRQSKMLPEPNSDELVVPSLTVNDQLGDLTLTSVTSYLHRANERQFDGHTYYGSSIAAAIDPAKGADYAVIADLAAPYTNDVYVAQWSQEFRLATRSIKESGHPYEAQVGVYFSNQRVKTNDRERVTGLGSTIAALYDEDPSEVLGTALDDDLLGSYTYTTTRREYAVFAEGSYMILPRLKATVGVRQSFSRVIYDMVESGYDTIGAPAAEHRTSNSHPITPKFALNYELSSEASLYANVSKGYRLGGNNNPLPDSCGTSLTAYGVTASGTYKPDSLWSYEAGTKLGLFGNRLTANASGYYIDWKNIQQSISLPSCGYTTTVNAGTARSYGGELEVAAHVTRALTVGATLSLTDAKIKHAATGAGTVDGQWLLSVPDHNYTAYFDYDTPLGDRTSLNVHADADFIGSSYGAFATTNADYQRPNYSVVNASIGFTRGAFEAMLYVKNLLNDDTIIERPSVVSVRQAFRITPRTFGLSGSYKF